MTSPSEKPAPAPVVDLAGNDSFLPPPSEDARRQAVTIGTILAALLLHLFVAALLLYDWRPAAPPSVHTIQVTLLRELPKPPPKPKPPPPRIAQPKPPPKPPAAAKPKPTPQPVKPKPKAKPPAPPQPTELKPRESGPDQRTEAKRANNPKPALPPAVPVAPKAAVTPPPKPLPEPPAPKPTPPKVAAKQVAQGRGVVVPLDRLPPALRPQHAAAPPIRNLMLRLPSPGGGTGTRDFAGDPYLNRLMRIIERNRIYPPADEFAGALARQAIFGILVDPSGSVTNIDLLASTGVTRLDEAAREMLTNSVPFPHLPSDYPQIPTPITVVIPIYPR